jgi:hypothetical protein
MAHRKSAKNLLIGTWRSDRRRTLAQWVYPKRLAAERRATFEAIFGRLLVKFTRSRHSTIYDGHEKSVPYRVIWSQEGPTFPQLVVVYGRGKNERAQHIFFDSPNSYYVQGGKCAEFFKRVPPNKSLERTRER